MTEDPLTLDDWLSNLLVTFRSAGAYQQKGHSLGLSNLENFLPPCQVYLFWFKLEPDTHYSRLIRTALAGRPDGETEVIGPIDPADSYADLAEFINQDRWSESVEDPMSLAEDERVSSARELLAQTLREAQRELDEYIVLRARGNAHAGVGSRSVSPLGFTWDIYGDPRSLKPKSLVKELAFMGMTLGQPSQRESRPTPIRAHAVHIYPNVRVGELPSQTPEEVLQGSPQLPWKSREKVFCTQYQGRQVTVRIDGLIAIESESAEEAMVKLNHIMAAALICGQDVRAVRLHEVGSAEIDPADGRLISFSTNQVSMRTAFLSIGPELSDLESRGQVDPDALRQAISKAEAVSDDRYLRNVMSFLLEAHTHYESQEYRQSFVMSWLIIESWLEKSWLEKSWSDALNDKKVSKNRQDRLSEGNQFTAAVKSEMLELLEYIDGDQLSKITTLRKCRNKVVHDWYDPTRLEAQEALGFARVLCSAQFQEATPV